MTNKEKDLINSIYASEKDNKGLLYKLFDSEEDFFEYVLYLEDYGKLKTFYESAINLNVKSQSTKYMTKLINDIENYIS